MRAGFLLELRSILTMSQTSKLIEPYCGQLVDLTVKDDELAALRSYATNLPTVQLPLREVCDLELLATGAFSPLDRFMGKEDFESAVRDMRLSNGAIFPIPISLTVSDGIKVKLDSDITLRDSRNNILAVMTVEEIYEWDHDDFSRSVLGTCDLRHPLNSEIQNRGNLNLSGRLRVLSLPAHFDFQDLRLTPQQTRFRLEELGQSNVVAFQTRNPLHRGHEEMCQRAMRSINGPLLLHPAVGMTRSGDVDAFTRIRSYRALVDNYFDGGTSLLALIPLAMRMAGPREAVWHMMIRRNYGANHFIVGRDHASPGNDSNGRPFYATAAAQELALEFSEDLGVKVLTYDEMVYLPDEEIYEEISKVESSKNISDLSGTKLREEYLKPGKNIPDWFVRPEVADMLKRTFPPVDRRGACVWFTGLSGAGKSTIAEILTTLLNEKGRNVTLLDGDVVRTHLSKGLGFTKSDRDTNIMRIGFVAGEVVRHCGIAVCAAVSPYKTTRNEVRQIFEPGQFIEVFVDTPLSVCEKRDVKGIYEKARRGEIANVTGIDDPYESPDKAEIVLDTVRNDAEHNARLILDHLAELGLVSENSDNS